MPRGDGRGPDGTYRNCMPVDEDGNPIPYARRRFNPLQPSSGQAYVPQRPRFQGRGGRGAGSGGRFGAGSGGRFGAGRRGRHRGPPDPGVGIGRGGAPRGGGLGLNARVNRQGSGLEEEVE